MGDKQEEVDLEKLQSINDNISKVPMSDANMLNSPGIIGSNSALCKGCGRNFQRIFSHFLKSPDCKSFNNVAAL